MGLSRVVATIAVFPTALALLLRRRPGLGFLRIALAHTGACGFAVAIAACGPLSHLTTRLLGKGQEGWINPLALALWWPYHLGLRIRLFKRRRLGAEPLHQLVAPGWYLGAWPPSPGHLPPGEPAVLDVTCELPRRHRHNPYLCLPVWDSHGARVHLIEAGVRWALEQHAAGRPVFIHCAHGHGRSATLLAAVLLASGKAVAVDEAVGILQAVRPKVRLNPRQLAALENWHTQCCSSGLKTLSTGHSDPAAQPPGSRRPIELVALPASQAQAIKNAPS